MCYDVEGKPGRPMKRQRDKIDGFLLTKIFHRIILAQKRKGEDKVYLYLLQAEVYVSCVGNGTLICEDWRGEITVSSQQAQLEIHIPNIMHDQ